MEGLFGNKVPFRFLVISIERTSMLPKFALASLAMVILCAGCGGGSQGKLPTAPQGPKGDLPTDTPKAGKKNTGSKPESDMKPL